MSNQKDSAVRIRRIFRNENSEKNQYTVQFAQRIETPSNSGTSKILSLAQGFEVGSGLVTALFSFEGDACQRFFGTLEMDNSDTEFETWPTADLLEAELKEKLSISVVENTTQNPATPNQTAKINPKTQAVLAKGGQPIFRHTILTTASTVKREFLQADPVDAPAVVPAEKVSALDAFGASGN